jgi:hypothetical protein
MTSIQSDETPTSVATSNAASRGHLKSGQSSVCSRRVEGVAEGRVG